MSAATASVADVRLEKEDRRRNSGRPQAQCIPMPLPAVGRQRIVKGNGTNVGTVISLLCPPWQRSVEKNITCIMGTNGPQWDERAFCQPFSPYGDYGFRVAVLASIISSGIILLMSVAFITCCLLDCIEDEKSKNQRESDGPSWEGQDQWQEDRRSGYSHKGWNNNNNNAEEKVLPWWETANPVMCENFRPCRCQQQYASGSPMPRLAALPGQDYDQPLLPQNLSACPPEYPGPPLSPCPAANSGLVHFSAPGSGQVWQYAGQPYNMSEVTPGNARNINTNRNITPKEVSIKIISV
ncbi:PREDICTED: uncharacterized protein LOC107088156 [Cyprinodon variegatus]|uniref:Uncharacterized LOC107088156 n=1 Tax=Cyprinodon variegatus TaxID=28743 RepID=A0A3Q2CYT3_CYPVA|nr:PREDICTED: uncharacterized protein LOC107088156 [Cyprinodon variegatus]